MESGPITVAAPSKARNVFARTNCGIVGLNQTQGMKVCLHILCLCVGTWLAKG
jgi:hypothetical protein